jgi:hypothetical protein
MKYKVNLREKTKGQSRMDNPEKLGKYWAHKTQDEDK